MRTSRSEKPQIAFPKDLLLFITVCSIIGFVVFTQPPQNIIIIFCVFALGSLVIFLPLKHFIDKRVAGLLAAGIGSFAFLYSVDLLDVINSIILISLLVSVGIFIHQK